MVCSTALIFVLFYSLVLPKIIDEWWAHCRHSKMEIFLMPCKREFYTLPVWISELCLQNIYYGFAHINHTSLSKGCLNIAPLPNFFFIFSRSNSILILAYVLFLCSFDVNLYQIEAGLIKKEYIAKVVGTFPEGEVI